MAVQEEGQPLLVPTQQRQYQSIAQEQSLSDDDITARIEAIKENFSSIRVHTSIISIAICLYFTAVNTTFFIPILNDVGSEFGASGLSFWIATSYLLSSCIAALIYTRLLDFYDLKTVTILSVTIFILGITLCTIVKSVYALIAYRTLAGLGGGAINPCSLMMMQNLLPIQKQQKHRNGFQLIYVLGIFSGASIGGLLSTWLDWRSAMVAQIPILAIAATLLLFLFRIPKFPKTMAQRDWQAKEAEYSWLQLLRRKLDLVGILLLASACISMMLGLTFLAGSHLPFSNTKVWGYLTLSASLILVLIWHEGRIVTEPSIPLHLLKNRNNRSIVAYHFLNSTAMAVFFYSPAYSRSILLQSASQVGVHLLSLTVSAALGFYTSRALLKRGEKRLKIYIVSFCVVNLCVPIYISTWSYTNVPSVFAQNFSLAPFAFTSTAISVMITSLIQEETKSFATLDLISLARYLGTITGISFFGAQIQYIVTTELTKRITGPDASSIIDEIRKHATKNASLPENLKHIAFEA